MILQYQIDAISYKDYLKSQELLQEVGRMLGGWIKSVQQKLNKEGIL